MQKLPSEEVYGHLSGELLDPLLVHEGREKERDNLRKFGVCVRVPRHQAVGQRVRVQWLDDHKRADTNGLLREDSCTLLRKTGVELRSHCVQRSERQIVWSTRRVGSILPFIA